MQQQTDGTPVPQPRDQTPEQPGPVTAAGDDGRLEEGAPNADLSEADASGDDLPDIDMGADGEPDAEPKGPMRRCIVTRESLPKAAMLRFVLGPGRELVPDLGGRLPGRGMWLSARADVLERALSRGAFHRAARGQVQLPPDLRARIETGLKGRIRDQVGLARRAGQAVSGFQQVREWLQARRAGLLVEASDGSLSERDRLAGRRGTPMVAVLTAKELGAVFGRDHAVHVAIAPGRIADMLVQEAGRLAAVSGIASGAGT